MKRFLSVYKYYLILLALCISIATGFLLGVSAEKHSKGEETDKEVFAEAIPSFNPETSEDRTSLGEFKLTAYCTCSKCCGSYSDGYTATMTKATPGRTIAVDPEVIPYGSIVEINGCEFVAEDCGGAIKGKHIDVLCASHELAIAFGVQSAEVYLINDSADYICQ